MITKKELLENGYREFEVPIGKEYASNFYQKKIIDDKGIKYHINIYFYEDKYEVELYFDKNIYAMRIVMYAFDYIKLDEIEKGVENIWISLGRNYYEEWE